VTDYASKGDQTRAAILEAAQTLFLGYGYHGTSMRAIASAAGNRAVAGLYNHFPTKQAIFRALLEERNPYDAIFGVLEPVLDEADTASDFVRSALCVMFEVMPRHYDFIQLAQIDVREFGGENLAEILRGRVFPRLLVLIARLEHLPDFKPVEGTVVLRIMASVVIGFMVTEGLAPRQLFGRYSTEEWSDLFANILLYGFIDGTARS
jgi:AcrR family transcriptional regulator